MAARSIGRRCGFAEFRGSAPVADVFFSYAREDRDTVDKLDAAFKALKWTTWFDGDIRPGERYRSAIQRELDSATAVVVLWSVHSVDAEWVHDEADSAKTGDRLVPVVIDRSKPPLGFGQRNVISLIGWDGTAKSDGYKKLISEIARRIEAQKPRAASPAPPPAPPRKSLLTPEFLRRATETLKTIRASDPLEVPVLVAKDSGLLTWKPVAGASSYEVQRCSDEYFLGPKDSVWEGDDLAYADPALAIIPVVSPTGRWRSSRSFYYRVRAVRAGSPVEHSEWSEPVRVTSK
jgi:hypothetical protein